MLYLCRHVVIGFARQGAEYILSYQLRIEYDDADLAGAPHYYSLHWWKFDPSRPLKHVCIHSNNRNANYGI